MKHRSGMFSQWTTLPGGEDVLGRDGAEDGNGAGGGDGYGWKDAWDKPAYAGGGTSCISASMYLFDSYDLCFLVACGYGTGEGWWEDTCFSS